MIANSIFIYDKTEKKYTIIIIKTVTIIWYNNKINTQQMIPV